MKRKMTRIIGIIMLMMIAFGLNTKAAYIDETLKPLFPERYSDPSKYKGKFWYNVKKDGTITLGPYTGNETDIILPSEIDGKKVTALHYTFERTVDKGDLGLSRNKTIKSVIIPAGVTDISVCTFSHCINLKSVTIPSSVKKIDSYAFSGCKSLKSITLPDGLAVIDVAAFAGCTGFKSLTLPNSIKKIGGSAFDNCTGLKTITIPYGVEKIECETFAMCLSLTNITIPNTVKAIDELAFAKCPKLKSVHIPSSVKSIGQRAFLECKSLKSVTIPETVKKIDEYAFGFTGTENYGNFTGPYNKIKGFTIKGYKGTAAEKYAEKYEFKFVSLKKVKVSSVKIIGAPKKAVAGETFTLKAEVLPEKSFNKKVKWISSDKTLAKVTSKGVVTINKKAKKGKTVKITAKAKDGSGKKKTVTIKIK